jgi:ribosomal protein S18 acetylase RimI-like enzyme
MWGDLPPDALYLHGLRVLRRFAGQKLGRAVLAWAERATAARGKSCLRLDVMGDNPTIQAYYAAAGFRHVCDRIDRPWPASLYEKQVTTMAAADPGELTMRQATDADADGVFKMLEAAAEWLLARGILQWIPGQIQMDWLRERITRGEVYVATLDGMLAGSFRLIWSDQPTWGTQRADAGYVHGLVINRAFAGQGLGLRLLERAERLVAAAGRPYLRLDSMNDALIAYYMRAGFSLVGGKRWDHGAPHLFEKRVQRMSQSYTPAGALIITRATADEVETAVSVEESATSWLRSRGIEPGNPPRPLRDIIAECVDRGEVYLAKRDGVAAGKIILQDRDDGVWADLPGDAVYVHGFMVHRAFGGQGVGLAMLRWAETVTANRGKPLLRLDCDGANPELRAYYERAGFTHRGDLPLPHRLAARYERRADGDGRTA